MIAEQLNKVITELQNQNEDLRRQRDELRDSLKLCAAVLAGETMTKSELVKALESARDILSKIKVTP